MWRAWFFLGVSRVNFQITNILAIIEKLWISDYMCSISVRPIKMTNHDNIAAFCETRNRVWIFLCMVSHTFSTGQLVYGFWWLLFGLCCGWILDYNFCEKNKTPIEGSIFYLEMSIVWRYYTWKDAAIVFGCWKYVVGLAEYGIFWWKIK